MAILTSGFITIKDFNDITSSPTAPTSPVIDQVWLDTSAEPPVLKTWNGSSWVETNGVTIGGRNILRNTALADESFFTFVEGTKLDKNTKNGSNNSIKYQLNGTDATAKIGATPQPQPVVFGEYYSASAEVFLPTSHGMKEYDLYALEIQCFNAIGGLITSYMTYGDKKTIGKWVKLKLENQVMPVGTVEATARIVVQGKAILWVSNLQLERGSKASDWTPSPEDVSAEINDAKIKAEEAEKNAIAGLEEAREANQQLNNMASDSILTPSEKQQISRTWEEIKVEKPLINKQAQGYGVSTSSYDSVFNALQSYVGTLALDVATNTNIAPTTFNAKFNDYYTERQLVLNKIAEESKKQAEDYTDSALEGVVVGGRNFLKYSDLSKSLIKSLISTRGNTHTVLIDETTKYMNKNTLKIVTSASGNSSGEDVLWTSVLGTGQGTGTGRKLLFSFYAKASKNTRLKARMGYGSYKTDGYADITTEWQRHVIDVSEVTNAQLNGELIFHLTSASTVWMTMAQLEDGTKVTDWTKAIEDLDDDMLDILGKAEEAEANAQKGIEQAAKAQGKLDEMASDSKLTAVEKQQIARDWEEIKLEKDSIIKQAKVYNVSTTSYVNAFNTLNNYISGLSLSSTTTTNINKDTFNSTFNAYYSQRQVVLDNIATKTKEYANEVVDGVVIGGTNLMTDSTGNLGSWSAGSVVDGYMGNKAYRVRRTTTGNSARQQLQKYVTLPSVNVGDSYTLSGWIFIEEDVTLNADNNQLYMRCYRKGSDNFTDICINNIPKSSPKGQWFRVQATSKLTISDIDVNRCMVSMALGDAGAIRFSMIKLERGTKASDWSPANEDLTNAYSIVLSNEAQVISTYNDRTPMENKTYSTRIAVYQGTKERTDFTIGSVGSANGITVSKNDSIKTVSFAVSTSTKLTADNGEFNIPITVDGKTFNKVFSWAVAKQGIQGNPAPHVAVSGEQVFRYTNNFTGAPTPTSIKIQTQVSGIDSPKYVWQYRRAGEDAWNEIGSATSGNQNYYTLPHDNSTIFNSSSVKSVTIRCTVSGKVYDEITIAKISDGATGQEAKTCDIVASNSVFKSTDGGVTFSPDTIKLTPTIKNTTFKEWRYSVNGTDWALISSGQNGLTISSGILTISKNSSLFNDNQTSVSFKCVTNASDVYDITTIVRLYDVTSINVGGRNLIENSGNFSTLTNWVKNGGTSIALETKDGNACIGAVGSITNTKTIPLKANTTYMYSAELKFTEATSVTSSSPLHYWIHDGSTTSGALATPVELVSSLTSIPANTWHRIILRFKTKPTIPTGSYFKAFIYGTQLTSTNKYWLKNIQLEEGNKETGWSPAPEDIANQLASVKDDLQTQVDGKIDTWSQESPDPASSWTTSDEKLKHKGDIWYKPTSKETYRYTGTAWERLYDRVAENATNIANQKRRVFVSTPTVPYDVGDLWINNEELYRCKTALSSGSYNSGHWVKAVKYTDDSVAQSAKNDLQAFKNLDEWLVINNELDTYFPFDNNLQTTSGVNPSSGYSAYLNTQGKFGNCLSVQEDVANLFAFNNISELNVQGNGTTLTTTKLTNEEVVCKYIPSSSTGLAYRGKDIAVDTQRTYTLSGWMYVSENYNSTSAPAIRGEQGFGKSLAYDMNKKGQWQFFSYTMKPSSATARILLYPRTSSSVDNATTGYVLYKNVQFTQTGAVHMFYNGTKPKDTISYEVSQPDVSTMMAYKKHVLDSDFKHQALVKNGSTFTFYENGVATTNYVNKWRVYACEGITTTSTDGRTIDKYNKPLSMQLTPDLTGIHHSWQATGYGYMYRTFLYCSEAKTITHMINFDNNGCAYCNGVLAGQGGYNANGNACVFNLVKGWNCIELANVDGDTGGRLSYVSSGSDGLFSNKTSHPEILYMTAELPIEMANNKVTYFSRANCFVDEAVFLNKTITQEEVKTYVGSGKRLTDPATVIDVPEPTNVTFSFS